MEVYNAALKALPNEMSAFYSEKYGKIPLAGSDNHWGSSAVLLGGVSFETPLESVEDFIRRTRDGKAIVFKRNLAKETKE
ncbi:MAG: hypothetical protein J6W28_07400 [Clostridia bacterium]|nr:hypothetical protein [Clostridia bacterium]